MYICFSTDLSIDTSYRRFDIFNYMTLSKRYYWQHSSICNFKYYLTINYCIYFHFLKLMYAVGLPITSADECVFFFSVGAWY